jgi:uncharacterized protein
MNRRSFLTNSALSVAGLMIERGKKTGEFETSICSSCYNPMEEALKFRKLDYHTHINLAPDSGPEVQIDIADRLGIEKMVVSRPIKEGRFQC